MNARIIRLVVDWESAARKRGFSPIPCETCGGRGLLSYAATFSHPHETTESCLECSGTGSSYGECQCGEVGQLVPLDGLLVCWQCAATCSNCGDKVWTVRHNGDNLCRGCFEQTT